jgi:hypothetical protein
MRTLYLFIAITMATFLAKPASAELIIYKGTLKQSAVGTGMSQKQTSQFYLIVDHDTANLAEIKFISVNNTKRYYVYSETNLHFVQISGPKGKTMEVIAHSPNECDINEGNTSDGVFLQGTDSTLAVNPGVTVTFPKILSGGGNHVSYSGGPIYVESSLVVGFDATQTPLSNGNGETLDAAVARISSILESQGFQKQSQKTGSFKSAVNEFNN